MGPEDAPSPSGVPVKIKRDHYYTCRLFTMSVFYTNRSSNGSGAAGKILIKYL